MMLLASDRAKCCCYICQNHHSFLLFLDCEKFSSFVDVLIVHMKFFLKQFELSFYCR